MAVLKLNRDNEEKEIDFELRYLKSLSTRQRFEMMLAKTREIIQLLPKNERGTAPQVIKRK